MVTSAVVVIVSFVVSVVVCGVTVLVTKLVDKDSNPLDKVRRYSDKRMKDFEDFFNENLEKLNGLSADLDTHQAVAIAAVKRLSKQTEDFEEISKTFEMKFSQVDDLDKRIENYSQILNGLMEMISTVDSKLKNLKSESVVLDKMNARINGLEKSTDSIQDKLPQITAEFVKINNESLKTLGVGLLDEYQNRAEELDRASTDAANKCEELLKRINLDIDNAYNVASAKAAMLEAEVLKRLQEEAASRNQNYLSKMEISTKELEKQLAIRLGETQKTIEEKTGNIEQQLQSRTRTLEDLLKERTENFMDAYDMKFSALEVDINKC